MAYNPKTLRFDYTFITCKGTEDESADEEATRFCSEMGKRGYKLIRWYIKETGFHYIVMEKQYRG